MAANSAHPWRWFPAIRPKVLVRPAEMAKIANIERKLVSGFGFSKGWAEFAFSEPPPLVPSCLIASWDAKGPMAMTCLPPSSVFTSW